jgi:hypothetical protein
LRKIRLIYSFTDFDDFRPEQTLGFLMKQVAPGTRVRVVARGQRERRGVGSFGVRVKLFLSGRNRSALLAPYNVVFLTEPIELVCEFKVP